MELQHAQKFLGVSKTNFKQISTKLNQIFNEIDIDATAAGAAASAAASGFTTVLTVV